MAKYNPSKAKSPWSHIHVHIHSYSILLQLLQLSLNVFLSIQILTASQHWDKTSVQPRIKMHDPMPADDVTQQLHTDVKSDKNIKGYGTHKRRPYNITITTKGRTCPLENRITHSQPSKVIKWNTMIDSIKSLQDIQQDQQS